MKWLREFTKQATRKFGPQKGAGVKAWIQTRIAEIQREDYDTVEGQARALKFWLTLSGGTLVILALLGGAGRTPEKPKEIPIDITREIPAGMILVPIQAANFSSLDPILGAQAWVDLHRPAFDGTKGLRVARSIALIRAPQNPSQLAIVIDENDRQTLEATNSPLVVVLRNKPDPKSKKTALQPKKGTARSRKLLVPTPLQLITEQEDSNE